VRSSNRLLVATCCSAFLFVRPAVAQVRVDLKAAKAAIIKADKAFNQSVADRDLRRFLSLVAEDATFSGGTPNEIHGRDAVGKGWAPMFEPGGPTLTWTPTKGEVLAGGDLGYTVGIWERRARGQDGTLKVTHGNYLTVWRKDPDGAWRAVYDTGSAAS
jgi:ketosteroid isomerase-like protein